MQRAAAPLPSNSLASPWDLASVVSQLVQIRSEANAKRRFRPQGKLPSRTVVRSIVDDLSAALFPNRLAAAEFSDVSVAYFIGDTLENSLQLLKEQIRCELRFFETQPAQNGEIHAGGENSEEIAGVIVGAFLQRAAVDPKAAGQRYSGGL